MNRWMAFESGKAPGNAHLVCLDFLLSVLSADPEGFTEDLVSDILSKAAEVLSLEALDVLLDFLNSQTESEIPECHSGASGEASTQQKHGPCPPFHAWQNLFSARRQSPRAGI